MPVEEVRLTARFKVDLADVDESVVSEIYRLFDEYEEIVNGLLELATGNHITSFVELCHARYHELRKRYPTLPSMYIVTACRHAASIYKSFMKSRKRSVCERNGPTFRGRAIWLHKILFKLDVEGWRAIIAVHGGRWITLRLLHGEYHERFKGMEHDEAQLVLRDDGNLHLNVVFFQMVMLPKVGADAKVITVDVNENVIAYGNDDFVERFETYEGIIRTRYFLKRRRIQSKVRGRELQRRLLEKYRGREWRRVREIYYKAAKEIIGKVKETGAAVIVMEDLEIHKEYMGSEELNGRLHRWSYRRFQQILEYQAKLHGLNVKYVDPAYTSRTCPLCGNEMDPSRNGRRLMRCRRCGLEEDRDVVAVKNLTHRYYEEHISTKISQNPLFNAPMPDRCGEFAFPLKALQ